MHGQCQREEPPARGSRMNDAPPVGKGDHIHWWPTKNFVDRPLLGTAGVLVLLLRWSGAR